MTVFKYHAHDRQGRRCRGSLEADSARHARQLLRERGLQPLRVDGHPRGAPAPAAGAGGAGLGAAGLALLTRQLATLVQAGLPLDEALQAVARQSEKRQAVRVLAAVRGKVLEGHGLAEALAGSPGAFPEVFRATVAAGERAGHLGLVLEQLADYTEARHLSRQRIQMAMVYPLILLVASVAIVAFLLGYVVPDVIGMFVDSGHPLPFITQVLINVSSGLQSGWPWLAAGLAALVLLLRVAAARPAWRLRWHAWVLRAPVVGKLVQAAETARFASTLAILGRSAVPLVDALQIAASVVANHTLRSRLNQVAQAVREGSSLTAALTASGEIPPMMLQMIASGEGAGELDRMLARAAQLQERDLAARIALAVGLFEPLMLVVMGAVVLLIVMAIVMPILSLNQLVN